MQLGIDSGQPTKMTHPFYTVCSILNNNEIGAQLIRKIAQFIVGYSHGVFQIILQRPNIKSHEASKTFVALVERQFMISARKNRPY
jgi:hypothetical protein